MKSLGAKGDGVTDDTAAIQAALAQNDRVYLPPGTYLVNNLKLKSGNELFGSGQQSIILQAPSAHYAVSANPGSDGSPDTSANITSLTIHHLKFPGQAGKVPFDEHAYLLNLNGVNGVRVALCSFVGYVGDGIYLGSSNTLGLERHNQHVAIENCLFDGVIRNNRNGISIIDGTNIVIQGCLFTRSGNINQPAGIDIEPDPASNAFARIQNIFINRCQFTDMGSWAMIAMTLQPQADMGHPAGNIRITNCHASNPMRPSQMMFYLREGNNSTPAPSSPPLGVVISHCTSDGVRASMAVMSLNGLKVLNCTFNNAGNPQLSNSINCTFSNVMVNGKAYNGA